MPGRGAWTALALLAAAGCGLAATDALLLRRFPLSSFVPGSGLAVGIREIQGETWREGIRWLVLLGLTQGILYMLALAVAGRAPLVWARRLAFGFPVIFAALLAGVYPIYATDVLHYLASSRVYWVFHDNALTVPPQAYHLAMGIPFAELPSPYGPLWTLLCAPAALVGAGDPLAGVLALKVMSALAYLGCAVLCYAIVRTVEPANPRRAVLAVVALAWNPFVVFRMVGSGHNDSVLLFFLLLAVFFAVRGRWVGVLPALAAAVLVKYVALVLLPPLVIYAVLVTRTRGTARPLWQLAFGGAHAGVLTLVVWAPLWEGTGSFALLREREAMYTSTPGLVGFQLATWLPQQVATDVARAACLAIGLMVVLMVLWRLWSGPPAPERLFAACTLTMLALLIIATPIFRPWYFLWVAGFAALLPGRGPLLLGVAFAVSTQFADLVEQYWETIPWVQMSFGRMLAAPVVVQFTLAGVLVLVLLVRTRNLTLTGDDARPALPEQQRTPATAAAALAPALSGER